MRGKLYKGCVRSYMLHGSETGPVKKQWGYKKDYQIQLCKKDAMNYRNRVSWLTLLYNDHKDELWVNEYSSGTGSLMSS